MKRFFSYHNYLLALTVLFSPGLQKGFAQHEELKQKISAFTADHVEDYDKKYLNIADREMGDIDNSSYSWKDEFMLKSKEKLENSIGNKSYRKFYFSVYAYETLEDRQYALKYWMENFIEGKSIRPGRPVRTYPYASPTIILINDREIVIGNYKCRDYTNENFEYWKDSMEKYFGNENTIVIEILCDGPLEWTKNSPDPKNRRGLF